MEGRVRREVGLAEEKQRIRRARQLAVASNLAERVRRDHLPVAADDAVDLLDYVERDLVLRVRDVALAPRDHRRRARADRVAYRPLASHERHDSRRHRRRPDERGQDVGLRQHRVPKVEHLLEQLVHRDEVLGEVALGELAQVRAQDAKQLVDKVDHVRRRHLARRHRQVEQAAVEDAEEIVLAGRDDGRHVLDHLVLAHLLEQHVDDGARQRHAPVLLQEHITSRRQNKQRLDHGCRWAARKRSAAASPARA
mmetsp:Transcript_24966/g.86984  ORF Transcript_24966/g.86984 Transcript_24966/m.86984 type:complete len:253 (-) Transcript_24966:166-924(-)